MCILVPVSCAYKPYVSIAHGICFSIVVTLLKFALEGDCHVRIFYT